MRKNNGFQIEQKIKSDLAAIGLTPQGQTLIVGLSGGPDSICLVSVLLKLEFTILCVHVNFKLRGNASDQDEKFVKTWCSHKGIELLTISFDTRLIAAKNKKGIEETARKLRYDWFGTICKERKLKYVLTGHHLNDQAELILMNLVRGTGLDGAGGMLFSAVLPYSDLNEKLVLVRPFLYYTKDEIFKYLDQEKIEFRNDTSNEENEFTRNKIRNQIIPSLLSINTNAIRHIAEFGDKIQAFLPFYDNYIRKLYKKIVSTTPRKITIKITREINEYSLYYFLSPFGFNEDTVKQVFMVVQNEKKGRKFISKSHKIIIGNQSLDIIPITPVFVSQEIQSLPFTLFLGDGKIVFRKCSNSSKPSLNQSIINGMDISYPVTIRNWAPGDRMKPLGMKGQSKKIKDILTDHKVSGADKKQALVLVNKEEIIWLYPTHTISESVKCNSHTREYICIETK